MKQLKLDVEKSEIKKVNIPTAQTMLWNDINGCCMAMTKDDAECKELEELILHSFRSV